MNLVEEALQTAPTRPLLGNKCDRRCALQFLSAEVKGVKQIYQCSTAEVITDRRCRVFERSKRISGAVQANRVEDVHPRAADLFCICGANVDKHLVRVSHLRDILALRLKVD